MAVGTMRELIEARIEAFNGSDHERLLSLLAEDVEWKHGVFHARGAGSGIELDVDAYTVYRMRDGLAWRVESWRRREDAERSSGLCLSAP